MLRQDLSHQTRFGDLLRLQRQRRGLTLTELGKKCGMDVGNLSRIERGERLPPKMAALHEVLKALRVPHESAQWRAFMSAAALGRSEFLEDASGTYLPYENALRGLPGREKPAQTYTVTEAASELGRVQATLGIKKITIEAADGSQFVFPIEDRPVSRGKARRDKKT